jgi:hypothetical protein
MQRRCLPWPIQQTTASAVTTAYLLLVDVKGSLPRAAPALDPDQQRGPREEH